MICIHGNVIFLLLEVLINYYYIRYVHDSSSCQPIFLSNLFIIQSLQGILLWGKIPTSYYSPTLLIRHYASDLRHSRAVLYFSRENLEFQVKISRLKWKNVYWIRSPDLRPNFPCFNLESWYWIRAKVWSLKLVKVSLINFFNEPMPPSNKLEWICMNCS